MAQHMDKNSAVEDYKLREKRLVIPFSITGNATPASKVVSNDLPAAMVLSTEGLTAQAAAIDSGCNFTTPVDANGIFGILAYNLGTVEKLLDVQLVNLSSGTATISRKGASSTGVTASGNIAVSIDSSLDLSMVNLSGHLVIEYRVSKA
jgi:hypothetical protein